MATPPPPCPLHRGTHAPPLPTDLRSPCPIINALANHGHLPRDGRNIQPHELRAAIALIGLSPTITHAFVYASYLEHLSPPPSGLWALLRNPVAYLLRSFGLRDPGQTDATGTACLNLDQLARHGAIEHDVSLSRRDAAQGDNHSMQPDLVEQLLASASDGKVITTGDFARLRRQRIEQQRRDNDELVYGALQHQLACGEAALIQTLFGRRGGDVPVEYVEALFKEERLPVEEGWRRRRWWRLGFVELNVQAQVLKNRVGKID